MTFVLARGAMREHIKSRQKKNPTGASQLEISQQQRSEAVMSRNSQEPTQVNFISQTKLLEFDSISGSSLGYFTFLQLTF